MNAVSAWALPWWKRYPGRLRRELEGLMQAGIAFSVDEDRRKSGVLALEATVPESVTGRGPLQVRVVFPDLYPQFRPSVSAPSLSLEHHQDPFGGNLCLIARGSRLWSEADTLAWLLTVQLPITLATADEPDPAQGEPVSAYFSYLPDAAVLADSDNLPPECVSSGIATMVVPTGRLLDGQPWIASVRQFNWEDGVAPGSRATHFLEGTELRTPWVRVDQVTSFASAEDMWTALQARAVAEEISSSLRVGNLEVSFLLALFPEEHAPGVKGAGVIVLAQIRDARNRATIRSSKTERMKTSHTFIRTARAGRSDLTARAPELAGAANSHILVIGCGALGSVIVDQLARCGIRKITVVDGDRVEPGNLMRHTATFYQVGLNKARAVADLARMANPEIDIQVIEEKIGYARGDGVAIDKSLHVRLAEIIAEAHLIIDATAEIAVHEVVADIARSVGCNYLYAESTSGAWGGYVAYFPDGADACWNCSEYSIQDGEILLPIGDGGRTVQPVACSEPTFFGTSFEIAEVAIHAARVGVSVLSGDGPGWATFDTVELRSDRGERQLPSWQRADLRRHPLCGWHG